MAIKLAGGSTTLEITPWFSSGYVFKRLTMKEEVGDNIASGVVELTSDGTNMSLINTENKLLINIDQVKWQEKIVSYKVEGFIYKRDILENEVHLYFIAINNDEFTTKSKVNKYNIGIKDIISTLYPGKVTFLDDNGSELEPDVKGDLDSLDQNGLTDYDFCSRLCRSYRKDSLYSFGLEGLSIKYLFRESDVYTVYGESDCSVIDMPSMNYYKEMNLEESIKGGSLNISPIMYGFQYNLVRNDFHTDLLSIYQYNQRYQTSLKCLLKLRFINIIPEFKIADIIKYENKLKFNKDNKYIITYINISIDLNDITFDCEASGWEDVKL